MVVLARLLTPESFGVMVSVAMVVNFAEIFTDAGFQKYLIQHEFESKEDLYESTTVAFWSNLFLALSIWLLIFLASPKIASLVGCPGYGMAVAISGICIPLSAFSSIQQALFKRNFDFKTLFLIRFLGALIPIAITIPVAYITRSYWALIIGMISLNVLNAAVLTLKSKWKPKLFFNFECLKKMLSFSSWTVVESVSIWLTCYIDVFIVGSMLNQYFLGIYKTSMTLVGQITSIITSATTPVLFSSLSRLQDDECEFKRVFFNFQKSVSILLTPLCVGLFLFSDLVVEILLGPQWSSAANFVGLWGLMSGISIVFSHYCTEVYRAKGFPKLSVLAQFLHIVVLWPAVYFSVQYGFEILYKVRAFIRIELILVNMVILYNLVRITPLHMLKNVFPAFFASGLMFCVVILLPEANQFAIRFLYIGIAVFSYALVLLVFSNERKILLNLMRKFFPKFKRL